MYIFVVSSWALVCIFTTPSFVLQQHISRTDTFFESMSEITATGPTVLSGLDDIPLGVLVWRSLLHWLGGIGFIVMTIAVPPVLRIGDIHLFQIEPSDRSEKALPRSHMAVKYIAATYVGIVLLDNLTFWSAGMSPLDTTSHIMSAISTDGFSAFDQSLVRWKRSVVH